MQPTAPPADLEARYYWLGALRQNIAIAIAGERILFRSPGGVGLLVAYATREEAMADGNPDPPMVEAVTPKDPEPVIAKPRRKLAEMGTGTSKDAASMTAPLCPVCSRTTRVRLGDDCVPVLDLSRCAAQGGFECRAVAQATAELRAANATLNAANAALLKRHDGIASCVWAWNERDSDAHSDERRLEDALSTLHDLALRLGLVR